MAPRGQPLVLNKRRNRRADSTEPEELGEHELQAIAESTLERCALNDKGLRALDISHAIFASRFYSRLGDALQHNTTLQELYLDNCQVDDKVLRVISRGIELNGGSRIRALSLEDNQIRCRGAGHLARLMQGRSRWARTFGGYRTNGAGPGRGLQYLSLKGNAIAAIGCKAIAEALMSSDDSLERLSLEANCIDDWGAGWFAMALRNHNVLRCLDLHRNPIGIDGIEELIWACESAKASLILLKAGAPPETHEDMEVDVEVDLEVEEQLTMVEGQRLATVYISEASSKDGSSVSSYDGWKLQGGSSSRASTRPGSASRPSSASRPTTPGSFSRPGSASRRQGQAQRWNCQLDIEEPAGGPMADSSAASSAQGFVGAVEAGCPSFQPRGTKVSAAGLACSVAGADGTGALRRSLQRAAVLGASTYNRAKEAEADATHPRCHPGERAAFAEEMETATGLAPPSRWRRKLSSNTGKELKGSRSLGGCGAAAARDLRRSQSTPGNRHGMLMGPSAASGAYGCSLCC